LISLEKKTDLTLCTYADCKFGFEVEEQADAMMQYV
jgi:hypothetical protein